MKGLGKRKATKVERLAEFCLAYPYLLRRHPSGGFARLNLDLEQFLDSQGELGGSEVFGTLEGCGSVFEAQDELTARTWEVDLNEVNRPEDVADADAEELEEVANYQALKGLKVSKKQAQLDAYVQRLEAEGRDHPTKPGYKVLKARYYRKLGLPGRRYARGPSLQKLCREARVIALRGVGFDVDIENCDPCVCALLMRELGRSREVPMLSRYAAHTAGFRSWIASWYGVTPKEAKKILIRVFYGGKPRDDNPLLWALARDVAHATDVLLADPRNRYLDGHFGDRRNPRASRLSYVLQARADGWLTKLSEALEAGLPEAQVVVFLFDGFQLALDPECRDKLHDLLELEGVLHGCRFVVKYADAD